MDVGFPSISAHGFLLVREELKTERHLMQRRSGFRITIFDNRTRGDNSKPRMERVVVRGSDEKVVQTGLIADSLDRVEC